MKFDRNGTILASPSMSTAPRAFRFGDFTLDLTRGALCAGDRPVDLRPKSFGVLAHLVQNAGRLVPKDELMQAVWPDVVASDEVLALVDAVAACRARVAGFRRAGCAGSRSATARIRNPRECVGAADFVAARGGLRSEVAGSALLDWGSGMGQVVAASGNS